jgi:hypothetical protein
MWPLTATRAQAGVASTNERTVSKPQWLRRRNPGTPDDMYVTQH